MPQALVVRGPLVWVVQGIEIGVEAQSGDDADIISDSTEEIDGGERSVADNDNPAAWQPAMNLQCNLASPVQHYLG